MLNTETVTIINIVHATEYLPRIIYVRSVTDPILDAYMYTNMEEGEKGGRRYIWIQACGLLFDF